MLNSPNPVDGDVQALIADCERDIAGIKQELSRYSQLPHAVQETKALLSSQLKRQQVALAALMAAPLASTEKHEISNMQATGMYLRAWPVDREENERDGFNIHLYTTRPAQLLRPVQLPPFIHSWEGDDVISGRNKGIMDCAEALRQQGYEVKS